MNHIYRIIFNHATGTFQAVSELAKSHSTSSQKTAIDQVAPPPP